MSDDMQDMLAGSLRVMGERTGQIGEHVLIYSISSDARQFLFSTRSRKSRSGRNEMLRDPLTVSIASKDVMLNFRKMEDVRPNMVSMAYLCPIQER